ncbi:hypothetical protein MIR68_001554 [Amoeboaphelidium protococcarum]|nr:hypothetical protein MIR68_001554 [Amoeboaphelidium protococcarum]
MGNIFSGKKHYKESVGKPIADGSLLSPHELPPMPPVEELNTLFDAMLEDLNLGRDKKEAMRQFPAERKWMIVQAHINERKGNSSENDYEQIITQLRNEPTTQLLSDLVVSLRARPIRWIMKFVENEGLTLLLNYLSSMEQRDTVSKKDIEHEELCIKCLKSLMNNNAGLSHVMAHPESLLVITLSMRSPSLKTRTLVLEMLAAVCLIPGGHKRILECMRRFQQKIGEKARFETVVNCLAYDVTMRGGNLSGSVSGRPDEKFERIIDLQIAALSFINSVINGGPGKDLDFRLSMRWEFIKLGVDEIVDRLSEAEHDFLDLQLSVFQDRQAADEEELAKRYDYAFSQGGKSVDGVDDAEEVFRVLNNSLKNTRSYTYFLGSLKHALLVPQNPLKLTKYWTIIELLTKQIILQKDGQDVDPDFAAIKVDRDQLINDMADSDKVRDAEDKMKKQSDRANKAVKEVESQKETFMKELSKAEETVKVKAKREEELNTDLVNHKKELARLENLLKERFANNDAILQAIKDSSLVTAGSGGGGSSFGVGGDKSSSPDSASPGSPTQSEAVVASGPPPPPPPAPPGMSGAPPPPPAPGMGGAPPPPPFGQAASAMPGGLPAKKNKLSQKPLKPLQWTKVNNAEIADTVWKQLDDAPVHKKMNYDTFESLFSAFQKKDVDRAESKANLSSALSSDNVAAVAEAPKITVLDSKRSQNVNILLKSLKLQSEDIRRGIYNVDSKLLPPSLITELLKIVPTADEVQMLQPFENDVQNMAAPEKFFWELSRINRYGDRIKALYVRGMYDEWCEDAKRMIKSWVMGSKELQTSKKFRELLQIILALGNYMNSGQKGGAYGYKLESLLKLGDVRSTMENRRHTLLHYLVDLVDQNLTDAKGWQDELKSVESAVKVELPVLRQTLAQLKNGVKDISVLLDNIAKDPRDPTDKFSSVMSEWVKGAQKKQEQLDSAFKDADAAYISVCKLFCEDGKTAVPSEFFGKVQAFIAAYNQSKADNEAFIQRQLELEKKEKEKMERNKMMTLKKGAQSGAPVKSVLGNSKNDADNSGDGGKDGELDDLISSIKSGKAFIHSGFAPQQRKKSKAPAPSKNLGDALSNALPGNAGIKSTSQTAATSPPQLPPSRDGGDKKQQPSKTQQVANKLRRISMSSKD